MASDGRKWPHMAGGRKFLKMAGNGRGWSEMARDGRIWPWMAENAWGLLEMSGDGQKWPEIAGDIRGWPEIARDGRIRNSLTVLFIHLNFHFLLGRFLMENGPK